MKMFHKLIGIVLSLTMITLISGCGGGSSDTAITTTKTGTVALSLTDAPTDDENIRGVYVTFDALRYQYADGNESWEDVDLNESRTINLLDLQDGNTTLLNYVELPAGEISHVRFVIDTDKCYIDLVVGGEQPLEVPSGDQTGFKAIGGFTIPAGGTVNVTADFDVRKSVTTTGNGRYLLRPTIKIIDNIEVGEINGTVTLNLDANVSSVIIYAYEDGTWDPIEEEPTFTGAVLSADATDGTYVLPWLTTGVYDLVLTSQDVNGTYLETLDHISGVIVNANETTIVDIP